MGNIHDFMSHDHNRLDTIYAQFKEIKRENLEKARDLFLKFKQGLEQHIIWEEEILFPIFERKSGIKDKGPTFVMKNEHKRIKEYLSGIKTRLDNNNLSIDNLEQEMFTLLKNHNHKEENILYPAIDRYMNDEETNQVLAKMK